MKLRDLFKVNESGFRPVHILIGWASLFAGPYVLFTIYLLTRRK